MKSLYEATTVEEVKERLQRLQPDTGRLWGVMTAGQMLAHCSAALEWPVGDAVPPRMFWGRILGPMLKPLLVNSNQPMRKNAGTLKSLVVENGRDVETERTRLFGLIDRFTKGGPEKCTKHPHSFLGRLTPDEWAVLMYKHLDHHLRQFGL